MNSTPLNGLRPDHPRLFTLDAELPQIRAFIDSDPTTALWYRQLTAEAEAMLVQSPIVDDVPENVSMLIPIREVLHRVQVLGGLYRLYGRREFAERARKELLAAAAFNTWHPAHFLDTAEMILAMATGYDWLYAYLSDADRAVIREAMIRLGLNEGIKCFETEYGWWTKKEHNWNQVCCAGLAAGALALGDEEPELCGKLLEYIDRSIALPEKTFYPDGGNDEGPVYWNYATAFHALYLAAMESAFDPPRLDREIPGMERTGFYRIHMIGPTNLLANFADCPEDAGIAPQMHYLGRRFHQPIWSSHEAMISRLPDVTSRLGIFELFWFQPAAPFPPANFPRDLRIGRQEIITMRSAWNDPRALYVAFKGGDNQANHGNLDIGTFLLDALGQRWAIDLGRDYYHLPGYWFEQRWTYYRMINAGHNTLVIDGKNQNTHGTAKVIDSKFTDAQAGGTVDMTDAYRGQVKRCHRRIEMLDRDRVMVTDEIEADHPVQIDWQLHTHATAQLSTDGRLATLQQGGETFYVRIDAPAEGRFIVKELHLDPPQLPLENARKLVLTVKAASTTIAVSMGADLSSVG